MLPILWYLLLCVPIYFHSDTNFHSSLFTRVQISKVIREYKRQHVIFFFFLYFCDWVTSLSMSFQDPFTLFLLFFYIGEWTSIVYGCHIFILHSSIKSHLDWLQFLGNNHGSSCIFALDTESLCTCTEVEKLHQMESLFWALCGNFTWISTVASTRNR